VKQPVDHILRPKLPWRDEPAITECGYDASAVKALSRDEYFARKKDLGEQRCAMFTCMTCSQTAERHPPWEEDPRLALKREIEWEAPGSRHGQDRNGVRLRDELLAMASIVSEHREAFLALVNESERRREWLEKKAAHEKPKPRTIRGL
jgi:hypothetical protein